VAFRKVNFFTELGRMARNQKPSVPGHLVAEWAVRRVKAGLGTDEVEQLERMFALEDPRGLDPSHRPKPT
jgi:hypothetical protein